MTVNKTGTGTPITGGGVGVSGEGIGTPPTLLGIERYAQIMQLNMPHFNQMNGPLSPLKSGCDDVWDHDARIALAETIQQAESTISVKSLSNKLSVNAASFKRKSFH